MKKLLILFAVVFSVSIVGVLSLEVEGLSEDFIEPYRDNSKNPWPDCKHIIAFNAEGEAYREWYIGKCGTKTTSSHGSYEKDYGVSPTIKNP